MSIQSANGAEGLCGTGIEGLTDECRPGRPRTVSDEQVAGVIERTLQTTSKDATRWSIRSMPAETGLTHTTIRRIWNASGLQLPMAPGVAERRTDTYIRHGTTSLSLHCGAGYRQRCSDRKVL